MQDSRLQRLHQDVGNRHKGIREASEVKYELIIFWTDKNLYFSIFPFTQKINDMRFLDDFE